MLMKIVKEAGFEIISNEDRACLLKCVENLQAQRDKLQAMLMDHIAPCFDMEEHF